MQDLNRITGELFAIQNRFAQGQINQIEFNTQLVSTLQQLTMALQHREQDIASNQNMHMSHMEALRSRIDTHADQVGKLTRIIEFAIANGTKGADTNEQHDSKPGL